MRRFEQVELDKLQRLLTNAKNTEHPFAHFALNEYMESLSDIFKQHRYSGSDNSNPCGEVVLPIPRNLDYNSAWIDT